MTPWNVLRLHSTGALAQLNRIESGDTPYSSQGAMFNQMLRHWRTLARLTCGVALVCFLLWVYWRPAVHAYKFVLSAEYRRCVLQSRNYELEEKSTPLYVTLEYHGRLGNWMYSYASLLGIAKANAYIPYLSSSHPLVSYFSLTKIQANEAECLQKVYDDLPCTYNPDFMNLPAGNISIDGYVQSWKYFRFMDEEIRREFKMHAHLKTAAREQFWGYVGKYLKEGRLIISIHVRRGDVLRPEARRLGFTAAPKAYFDNAMNYMLERYPHSVFFVTSDDIHWCKENIIPPQKNGMPVPIVFSSSTTSWEDFAMLTLCNHSILSVGTFGWWSAWLANGHVVYYKEFPLPDTKIDFETNKEDYFPTHWVALSSSQSSKHLNLYFYFLFILLEFCLNQLFQC